MGRAHPTWESRTPPEFLVRQQARLFTEAGFFYPGIRDNHQGLGQGPAKNNSMTEKMATGWRLDVHDRGLNNLARLARQDRDHILRAKNHHTLSRNIF